MTTQTTRDRAAPQALVDLAVLAIKHGAARVSVVHEGLGHDFGAPIGWLLWIVPRENGDVDLVTHQIGCDLSDILAPAWLAEPAASETPDHPVVETLVEVFQNGIRNGWDVTYERQELEHENWQRLASVGLGPFGMRHELRATAPNWAYDDAAHARGDQVSTEISYSIREGVETDPVVFSNDGGTHRQVAVDHVEALLQSPAPNFVPVAYFDEDREEWVK